VTGLQTSTAESAPAPDFRPWKALDPDEPRSLVGNLRQRRWSLLLARFPELASMHVLDLGGTPRAWAGAPVRPERLVILNTEPSGFDEAVAAEVVTGDACAPPPDLGGHRFDLVFSNSVLEHVGGHDRRKRFADTVRAAAPRHWVQTPYRYFPIEPHFVFPGYQFLPVPARVAVARRWGPTRRGVSRMSPGAVVDYVQSIELLGVTDMAAYFPESEIVRERFAGVVKSLVAVR
jgi:hypothetical protein